MPIYEYECQECGQVSEVFLRGTDSKDIKCAKCGSKNLKRLVSVSHMIGTHSPSPGTTCCGRAERCETPPCSEGDACRRG